MPLLRLVKAEHIVDFAVTLGTRRLIFCSAVCTQAHKVAAVIINGSPKLVTGSPGESHIPAVPTAAAAFWQRHK